MHDCMNLCMYVCMHVCMHVCMYVSIDLCMYVCMHACMYVCMCVYVCSLNFARMLSARYVFNPHFGCVAALDVFKNMVWKKRALKTLIVAPPLMMMLGKSHKHRAKTVENEYQCIKSLNVEKPTYQVCKLIKNTF